MESKRYIIAEDVPEDAHYLKKQLDLFPFLDFIQFYQSIDEVLYALTNQQVDLVFLDINLNGQNGLNVLQALDKVPQVIITSAYLEHAVESYEIGKAADYILKPVSYARLLKALSRALSIEVTNNGVIGPDYVFLKMGRQIQRFDLDTIDYIEAYGIYSKVHVKGQVYIVNERMLNLEETLNARMFHRIHKSYLVNISKITRFDRNYIWIGSFQIPIGNSFRPKVDGLYKLLSHNEL